MQADSIVFVREQKSGRGVNGEHIKDCTFTLWVFGTEIDTKQTRKESSTRSISLGHYTFAVVFVLSFLCGVFLWIFVSVIYTGDATPSSSLFSCGHSRKTQKVTYTSPPTADCLFSLWRRRGWCFGRGANMNILTTVSVSVSPLGVPLSLSL